MTRSIPSRLMAALCTVLIVAAGCSGPSSPTGSGSGSALVPLGFGGAPASAQGGPRFTSGDGITITGLAIAIEPCTNAGEAQVWNGSGFVCTHASSFTNSAGANVLAKSDGTNIVASSGTDDGATVEWSPSSVFSVSQLLRAQKAVGTGVAGTDYNLSVNDLTAHGTLGTGGVIRFKARVSGADTTGSTVALIRSERENINSGDFASKISFVTANAAGTMTRGCTLSSAQLLDCVTITEGGSAVLSGTITSNTIPKGSSGNLTNSVITDVAGAVAVGGSLSTTGNFTAGDANTDVVVLNGYTQVTGTSAGKFIYLSDLGTNYGVIYDSGGKIRIGGAATPGGVAAIESFEINPNAAAVSALGTLGVTGLATLTGGFTLGADSSAASHKITNLTNGSGAQDAAAFGQIQAGIAADFTGSTNVLPKRTGTTTYADSSISDDGSTVATALSTRTSTGTATWFGVGRLITSITSTDTGWRVFPFNDNNIYIDAKLGNAGSILFRTGHNTEQGDTRTWLTVTGSNATTLFAAGATFATTINVNGNATLGDNTAVDTHTFNGFTSINGTASRQPLDVLGRDSATSGVVARFVSATSGSLTFLQISDGFTYNFGIGTDASGNLSLRDDLAAGSAGTERMRISTTDGKVTAFYDAAINGNATIGDATTDSHTVNGKLLVNTAAGGQLLVVQGATNGLTDGAIQIKSNKNAWGTITGQLLTTAGGSTTTDNLRISTDSGFIALRPGVGSDALTILHNGDIYAGDTANSAVASNLDVITVGNTGTGQTADQKSLIAVTNSGSYNTTAGALLAYGVTSSLSATRSAGANGFSQEAFVANVSSGQNQNYGFVSNVTGATAAGNIGYYASVSGSSGTNWAFFGNAGTIYNAGDLVIDGTTTLGNSASSDQVLVNGRMTGTTTGFSEGIQWSSAPVAFTLNSEAGFFSNTGTFNTTSSALESWGAFGSNTSTRSSGANNLFAYGLEGRSSGGQFSIGTKGRASGTGTNYGLYAEAFGGTVNNSFFGASGSLYNAENAGIGVSPDVNMQLKVITTNRVYAIDGENTPVAGTADVAAINGTMNGTVNTTAGQRVVYGLSGAATSTRSAGANNLIDVGLYGHAAGGQLNWGLWIDAGDAHMDSNAFVNGSTTLGDSDSVDGVTIHGNIFGTVVPADANPRWWLTSTPSALASDTIAMQVNSAGSLNATAAVRTAYGIYGDAHSTRSAGANNVQNIAGFFTAGSGQLNLALYTAFGDNWFNVSGGTSQFFGNLSVGDSAGDILDVNGQLTQFGNTRDGLIYIFENEIDAEYAVNADPAAASTSTDANNATMYISYSGYQHGATRFRDTYVGNGKGAQVALFHGADKHVYFRGAVDTADTLTATASGAANTVVTTYTGTTQTAERAVLTATNSGTFNTTSGALNSKGITVDVTSTRSSGANTLTNIATLFSASGAQANYALWTNDGEVLLNNVSGGTTAARNFAVNGNATIGDTASSDAHTINGSVTVSTSRLGVTGFGYTWNPASETNSRTGFDISATGTWNTTGGPYTSTALNVSNTSTEGSGSSTLSNVAAKFSASGGDGANYAIQTLSGIVEFNKTDGTVTAYGGGIFGDTFADPLTLGQWVYVNKLADEDVTNSAILQSDDYLVIGTTAGKIYRIIGDLTVSGSSTAGDIKFDFAVLAGTMECTGTEVSVTTADAIQTTTITAATAADTTDTAVGTRADASFPIAVHIDLACKTSNTTQIQLRFAQNTQTASTVARIMTGSRLIYAMLN